MSDPECVVCHKPITWKFWLCAECEEKYGRSQDDPERPEWVRFLVRDAARMRREDAKYIRMRSYEDFDNSDDSDISDADIDALRMVYAYSFEVTVGVKWEFQDGIKTSDGEIDILDSDWEAVYSYSV